MPITEEPLYQEILRVKEQVKREIEVGGTLTNLPCPFCGLPRCERSDYIRCSHCGINWGHGQDYSHDPKIAQYKAMVAGQTKAQG